MNFSYFFGEVFVVGVVVGGVVAVGDGVGFGEVGAGVGGGATLAVVVGFGVGVLLAFLSRDWTRSLGGRGDRDGRYRLLIWRGFGVRSHGWLKGGREGCALNISS